MEQRKKKTDYISLINRFSSFSEEFKLFNENEKYTFFYSGGADSSALLSFLIELRKKIKFAFEVYLITAPSELYTTEKLNRLIKHWGALNIPIKVVTPEDSAIRYDNCEFCKDFRVDETYKIIQQNDVTNIVAGFTKDELIYYYFLFNLKFQMPKERSMRRLLRFYPQKKYSMGKKIKTIIHPLLDFTGLEILPFLEERGVPYLREECNIALRENMYTCLTGNRKYSFLYDLTSNDQMNIKFKYLHNWVANNYPELKKTLDISNVFTSVY